MTYGDLKIQQAEQLLIKFYKIKHLILLEFQNMTDIKEVLPLCFTNFLIKSLQVLVLLRLEIMDVLQTWLCINQLKNYTNKLLKLKKKNVYSAFEDNIWGTDLADIQLISQFNKGFRVLCVIDIFSKYAWVAPLKDEKGVSIVNTFQEILNNSAELRSSRKPKKIWVDKESEFYKSSFKNV